MWLIDYNEGTMLDLMDEVYCGCDYDETSYLNIMPY